MGRPSSPYAMHLEKFFPRPLDPGRGTEAASLMDAMITAAHLDRRLARSLGWRGIKSSGGIYPAWTFRVAQSKHVYGLVFYNETVQDAGKMLEGNFGLYVFPDAESELLDVLPLEAMRIALGPAYHEHIRDLSRHVEELAPFRAGFLTLRAWLDRSGLTLGFSAPARLRQYALDGVSATMNGQTGWLVEPGGAECDIPAFRLLLRPFAVFAASFEALLEEPATVRERVFREPATGFDAKGTIRDLPDRPNAVIRLAAGFGAPVPDQKEDRAWVGPTRTPAKLPGRHIPGKVENSDLPVLHILTGFLGAGKTTFLKNWLNFLHGRERYTGVLQNEIGEVDLDSALLESDTQVEALDEGCVCCSLADSLRPGLLRLKAQMPADQFILETTGLANPANLLDAARELDDLVLPGLVITVMDAVDLLRMLKADSLKKEVQGIRLAQVEKADILVINKADAIAPEEVSLVTDALRAINPRALVLPGYDGSVAFAELDAFYNAWLDRKKGRLPSRQPFLDHFGAKSTHEDEGYGTRVVRPEGALALEDIRKIVADAGPGLVRAKGVVELEGHGVVTLQYAAGRLEFEQAPRHADDRFIVLIGKGMAQAERLHIHQEGCGCH